ncbi:hypothetical protein MBLNU457_g2412t1 [Dothideomycetes sp. NU457]
MEHASLTLAHAHARKASEETQKARLATAGTEHERAAEEYRKTIEDVEDSEALRVLRLIEEHHRKLAEVIRSKDQASKRLAEKGQKTKDVEEKAETMSREVHSAQKEMVVSPEKPPAPSLFRADPRRDSSPALAKDMASRRGIPQVQQRRIPGAAPSVSTAQATGRMSAMSTQHSTTGSRPSDQVAKPTTISQGRQGEGSVTKPVDEEGFARFYSNITSGPLSKLSSMLAFAGLPLAEQSPEDSPTQSRSEKTSARAHTGPDVNQIFSKAALRALEEQQRNQGFSGSAFGPGESFYVIPTSGGTASYANILSQQHGHKRSKSTNEPEEFVDAKEHLPRNTRGAGAESGPSSVREEELQMENTALKQILDKLSHRLQAFESHAQDASMAALTQSMASVRSQPQSHGLGPQTAGISAEMEERMRAMEAQLEREMKERERLDLENQKQRAVLAKYRSHWEQVKASARLRDQAKRDKNLPGLESDTASTQGP